MERIFAERDARRCYTRGMRGLEDLTAEDILACKGAERIAVSLKNHDVNDGREVIEMQGNTGYHWCMT